MSDDLSKLVADLTDAGRKVQGVAYKVTKKSALEVKRQAVQFATGIAHAPHYPRSIGFDMDLPGLRSVGAEIGPDKNGPQGALGVFLEYGDPRTAPHPHLAPALDRVGPDYLRALADGAGDLL